ncbi:MAG: DNA-binding protein [Desulfobulbaceae bacterium]|nr:DNA-binding protein [Desulfobulbaceae bacterium]
MCEIPIKKISVTASVKRLLSIKDLVAVMGATEWFWRSQIWDGKLKYVQVGKKMFVDREDVETFIQSNKFKN